MYTFVTGGLRSGRSSYALRRASELGPPPWLYVTAREETDEAIKKRIQHHRRDAEAIWRTCVMSDDPAALLQPEATAGVGALVLDGLTPWLSQRLAHGEAEKPLLQKVAALADLMYRSRVPVVAVATEMMLAVPPEIAEHQKLVHTAASANQIFAAMAGAVVLMVSGVPLRVR